MALERYRELTSVRAAALEPTGDDLRILSRDEFAGRPVAEGEVHVGSMLLAHDQFDRSFERFPPAYLRQFALTAPGKAMLPGHDKGALPLGRFFRGGVEAREEEFPVLVTERGKAAERVPGFKPQRTAVNYLRTDFYFAATPANEALRANIATGVYKSVSIGYKYAGITCDLCQKDYLGGDCPHFAGQWVEGEGGVMRMATATYSGDSREAEMREGSIVWLGAQPNARLAEQARSGAVDPQAIAKTPWGDTDLVALKEAEALARIHGHAVKSWAFPALATAGGGISSMEDRQAVGRESTMADEQTQDQQAERQAPPAAPPAPPLPPPVQLGAMQTGQMRTDYLERSEAFRSLQREVTQLKGERDTARTQLGEREQLLDEILQDIGDEVLHCAHILGESTSRAADFVSRRVETRNWKELRDELTDLRERVAVRFPTGTSGDTRRAHEEPAQRDLREYDVV